jgi:DNA primase
MNLNRNYAFGAEKIAGGLQKPKRAGRNRFVACCPAHDDKTPSLSIEDSRDGKVLVHCFAGCSQDQVIGALRDLGLWHKVSRDRINYLKNQTLSEEIRKSKNLLELAISEYENGVVHSELDRARIKKAIRFLQKHGRG